MLTAAEITPIRALWAAVAMQAIADFRIEVRHAGRDTDKLAGITVQCRSYWSSADAREVLNRAGLGSSARTIEGCIASSLDPRGPEVQKHRSEVSHG